MPDPTSEPDPRAAILNAALAHVPFEGWSDATLRAAAADTGQPLALARALYPRGGVDLALAFHAQGDAEMVRRLAAQDLSHLRLRERVAHALRMRLELVPDRELVRRGATLFALPQHAADGARALWATADAVWTALGQQGGGFDHFTRRATLAGVHASTVLYWLGDDSPGHAATWDFLNRRIEDVMRIEKTKARLREVPILRPFLTPREAPPAPPPATDHLPGRLRP